MTLPIAPLGDLVEVTSGFAFKSTEFNDSGDGLPLVRIRDVVDGASDTYYSGDYKPDFLVENGDALIGMDGEFNLGRWRGGRALLNQRVCKVVAKDKRLDHEYLLRFLPSALKSIEDATPFVTVKHLSVKVLRDIRVPLPPLPEQRRIAAILDKADALRAKRREAIAKLDQLLQSVFLDMFGDPVTNPKGWPVGRIGDMLESVKYGTSAKAALSGPVPVLRMNNLTSTGEMDLADLKFIDLAPAELNKCLVRCGDILFNRTNSKELVGKTAVYEGPEPMAFAGYLVRGRVSGDHAPEYIAAYLNSPWGKKKLRGMCKSIVGMANINAQEFAGIEIAIPSPETQNQFGRTVRAIRQKKSALRKQMLEFDRLFAALQGDVFAGHLAIAA